MSELELGDVLFVDITSDLMYRSQGKDEPRSVVTIACGPKTLECIWSGLSDLLAAWREKEGKILCRFLIG